MIKILLFPDERHIAVVFIPLTLKESGYVSKALHMTIEIHNPPASVEESFLKSIEKELLDFSHKNPNISRAEVSFREDESLQWDNKICEIKLVVFTDSLFARRVSGNYYLAAREVLDELAIRVQQQADAGKEPPEEITSTVDV